MMRRLLTAAGIGLAALPASAQLPPDEWFSPCGGPAATCVSPKVDHLLDYVLIGGGLRAPRETSSPCDPVRLGLMERCPAEPCLVPVDRLSFYESDLTPIADGAGEILARWEIASQTYLPVAEAERLRMRYAAPERSGQELALTCELHGPIEAAELTRRYAWAVTEEGETVELTAVPKDRLERMFYDRFTVTLRAAEWRPVELRFVTPGGEAGESVALRPWIDEDVTDVRLVAFESSREERPVRTADLSDTPPRLLMGDTTLELPPTPMPCEVVAPVEPVEATKR